MVERERTLAAYARAWERAEEPEIRASLERCLTSDSIHVSPLSGVLRGVDGLVNLILDFPVMFPNARLRVTGCADIHHDKTFCTWRLTSTARIRMMGHDYGTSLDGVDFVEFGPEGTIRNITSFFDVRHLAEPHEDEHLATTRGPGPGSHTPPTLHLEERGREPSHR